MSDDVLIFEGSKKKAALLLLISTIFVLIGLLMISEGKWFGWVAVGFFGLGIPVSLFMLKRGTTYLRLDKNGIEIKPSFKPMALIKWRDVDGFYIGKIYGNKMIGITYSRFYNKQTAARKIAVALADMEGAIPDHFKSSPEDICEKLNLWKQKYG